MTQADLGEAINGDGAALIVTSVRMPLDKQTLLVTFLFCIIRSERLSVHIIRLLIQMSLLLAHAQCAYYL